MREGYIILAFQKEGESYDNASVFAAESEAKADEKVSLLRSDGFVVFIVTKPVKRFDGIITLHESRLD